MSSLGGSVPSKVQRAFVVLNGHVRVEPDPQTGRGSDEDGGVIIGPVDRVIEPARTEFPRAVLVHLFAVAETAVRARARLGGLEEGLGLEFVPPLVGPPFSRRPPFRGRRGERTTEETFDRRFPGVQIHRVRYPRGERPDPGLRQERLQGRAGRPGLVVRGRREGIGRDRRVVVEHLGAELLEEQHLLGERLGPEERARLAVCGDVERAVRLAGRRHGIVDAYVGDVSLDAPLEDEGPFVRGDEPYSTTGG